MRACIRMRTHTQSQLVWGRSNADGASVQILKHFAFSIGKLGPFGFLIPHKKLIKCYSLLSM